MAGINVTKLKEINVLLPSIKMQQDFAEVYLKIINDKNKYKKNILLLDNLFNSLMQKAFKGELQFAEAEQSFQQLELSF